MVDIMIIGNINKDYDIMRMIADDFLKEGHSVRLQYSHCPCNFTFVEDSNTVMAVKTDDEFVKKLLEHAQKKRIRTIEYNPHKMGCVKYRKKITDLILDYYNEHGQGPQSITLGNDVVKELSTEFFCSLSSKEGYNIPEIISSNSKNRTLIRFQ